MDQPRATSTESAGEAPSAAGTATATAATTETKDDKPPEPSAATLVSKEVPAPQAAPVAVVTAAVAAPATPPAAKTEGEREAPEETFAGRLGSPHANERKPLLVTSDQSIHYTEDNASGKSFGGGSDPTKPESAPLVLPLSTWERVRFGLLWGMNLAQQDFEKYLLYFLLAQCTVPECDYLTTYSTWLLVASLISFPVNVLSGWITDYTARIQHRVQQVSFIVQTLGLIAMFAAAVNGQRVLAQVMYQIRQAAMVQSLTSVWKILKIRLDVVTHKAWLKDPSSISEGRMKDIENIVVSAVGNFGDISAEIVELSALGSLTLLTRRIPARKVCFVMGSISLLMNIVPLVLSFVIHTRDLIVPKATGLPCTSISPDSLLDSNSSLASPSPSFATPPPEPDPAPAPLRYGDPRRMGWRGKLRFAERWVFVRLRFMMRTAAVLNAMLHSLTILVLYSLMTYPITILVGTEEDHLPRTDSARSSSSSASSASETLENYCGGTLINLIEQGAVLMVCYFVSSFLYLAVLVRCPPKIYYK